MTDLFHAALEVAQGASGFCLLIAAMWIIATCDERRHARRRAQAARFHAQQSRARVLHLVERGDR